MLITFSYRKKYEISNYVNNTNTDKFLNHFTHCINKTLLNQDIDHYFGPNHQYLQNKVRSFYKV